MNRYFQQPRRWAHPDGAPANDLGGLFREDRAFNSPDVPDPNEAAVAGTIADAQNFPLQYAVDAVAKMGGKWTDPISGKVYDFTGLGDAENNAVVSDQMAQTLLDIQKNYGAAYVKQRLADLQQSDPKGYAARKELFARIMADAEKSPDRPMAADLQAAITDTLQKGGKLDARQLQQVQEGVRGKQVAHGIILGNAPASEEAGAVVKASEAMRDQRQQEGLSFQTSGVSPEDVAFRQIQQSLANLGAFVNNQTPTAQFGQLAGAQNGAAPTTTTGTPSAALNPNAGAQGISNAFAQYNNQSSQANPWLAAASAGVNAAAVFNNLGAWNTGKNPAYQNYLADE